MTIVVFGDSITNRAGDETGGGWTSRLDSLLARDFNTQYQPGVTVADHGVFELGIGGDTILGIERRFESELQTRIDIGCNGSTDGLVVGIAVGINDSRVNEKARTEEVPFDVFQKTYRDVLLRLQAKGTDVFCVGLTPCDEARCHPVLYSNNLDSYFNERIAQYDAAIHEIAQSVGVTFVDVLPRFTDLIAIEGADALLDDGLHPNGRGHQLIADSVSDSLRLNLLRNERLGSEPTASNNRGTQPSR